MTSHKVKCQANLYLTSGFVWLQTAVDTALIKVSLQISHFKGDKSKVPL